MQRLLTNRSILPAVLQPILPQLDTYYNTCLLGSLPQKAELVPVTLYLQPQNLKLELVRKAEELATDRLKVAASEWLVEYVELLLPLVLIPATLAGFGVDCTPANLSLLIENEHPKGFWLENSAASVVYIPRSSQVYGLPTVATLEEFQQFVFRTLFKQHLSTLFDQLTALTGISSKLLWGITGRAVFNLYSSLQQSFINLAIQEDFAALLQQETNLAVAEGRNPLYRVTYLDKNSTGSLNGYCLQPRMASGFKCGDCPLLNPAEKIERWRTLSARNF